MVQVLIRPDRDTDVQSSAHWTLTAIVLPRRPPTSTTQTYTCDESLTQRKLFRVARLTTCRDTHTLQSYFSNGILHLGYKRPIDADVLFSTVLRHRNLSSESNEERQGHPVFKLSSSRPADTES